MARLLTRQIAGALVLVAGMSCSGGGGGGQGNVPLSGSFRVETINVLEGDVWPLNRVIELRFNQALDPDSIGFGSVKIRPLSPQLPPVTGNFEWDPNEPQLLRFRPACPNDAEFLNGGFRPGGFRYEINLPTQRQYAATVLRNRAGTPLTLGLRRRFRTPLPPHESLFLDTTIGPPRLLEVDFPSGLNLFTRPDPAIRMRFDQSIDARPTNLNLQQIQVLYSDQTVSSGLPLQFPEQNRLPGTVSLLENCAVDGARIVFQISGVLPPDRELRVRIKRGFRDLSGESSIADQFWLPHHRTPTLSEIYQDPTWQEDQPTLDEFREDFATSHRLDMSGNQGLPPAEWESGRLRAAFDFPGRFMPSSASFELRDMTFMSVETTSTAFITDSNNRTFTVQGGVLYVHDFIVRAGSTIRGRGIHPLVIYASGEVIIEGTIDVSGNDATAVRTLNSPQFPEGGALGECGGGHGGTSSLLGDRETPRGERGYGAFNLTQDGGGGGEGGYQAVNGGANMPYIGMAGGGGGNFALTPNIAIIWDLWRAFQKPSYEPVGADIENKGGFYPPELVLGAEPGIRGNSMDAEKGDPARPHGAYGMEDMSPDDEADETPGFNPPGNLFKPGHPVKGPDPGEAGASIFRRDGDPGNDFWGRRLNDDLSVTVGELLVPWAGSGGGASGDSHLILRLDLDRDGTLDPMNDFWPDRNFPRGSTSQYRKGAPGGGGGGQLLIMSVGPMTIGAAAQLLANGGIGQAGELRSFNQQVSGSGGGSGGHVVLATSAYLDLSAIDIGDANKASQINQLEPAHIVRAFGGRRGWCGTELDPSGRGNGDFMVGRGGAGANGVIQIHVSNPARDLLWHPDAAKGIRDYMQHGDPERPADPDRVEEMLALITTPQAYSLIPFFSSQSMAQSDWIDTGLAGLRNPPAGSGPYPDWMDPQLHFDGIETSGSNAGLVRQQGDQVVGLADWAQGPESSWHRADFEVEVEGASNYLPDALLRNPTLLVGADFLPQRSLNQAFELVMAEYDRITDRLRFQIHPLDGPLPNAPAPAGWSLRPKFFRIKSHGLRDRLPRGANLRIEFQGAAESAPGSHQPGAPVPGAAIWTADLAQLKGLRFLRYRVVFNIDALGGGIGPATERPGLELIKIPYSW